MKNIKPKKPQKYVCTICGNKYTSLQLLSNHTLSLHKDLIDFEVYESVEHFLFDRRNPKSTHICPICKKNKVQWNQSIFRYNRFCSDPKTKCKNVAGKIAKENMKRKYGKEHLLNDPEMQRTMLNSRSISGSYTFSDKTIINYVGSYELDFLTFYDKELHLSSQDIMQCEIIFTYKYEKEKHFYMPDFYIPSLNIIIEIKDGGDNPNTHNKIQNVDKIKEKLKDEAIIKSKAYNYIKIINKEYSEFITLLSILKNEQDTSSEKYIIIP